LLKWLTALRTGVAFLSFFPSFFALAICRNVMNDDLRRDVVLFAQALQLPASERSAFLERACGADTKLRERVEGLLQAHDSAGDFLEKPPPDA